MSLKVYRNASLRLLYVIMSDEKMRGWQKTALFIASFHGSGKLYEKPNV
jgi:hypothetical protein